MPRRLPGDSPVGARRRGAATLPRWLPCALALPLASCAERGDGGGATAAHLEDPGEEEAGGSATVFDATSRAFARPLPTFSPERADDFFVGNAFFNTNWVAAPASAAGRDGLGPLFNARSCAACHPHDGRGDPELDGEGHGPALLVKLARAGGAGPEATYGDQLQEAALPGVAAEGALAIEYAEEPGTHADGTPYSLRRPLYRVDAPGYGPLEPGTVIAPIAAPAMFGLGLLAAVAGHDIEVRADPDDLDGDGISGRIQRLPHPVTGEMVLGRFGWKASQPTLLDQASGAFNGDMGLTTPLVPDEPCTDRQYSCAEQPSGGAPEVGEDVLGPLAFYLHGLAVPGRRRWRDDEVRRGRRLFFAAGCDACHAPVLETGELDGFPELSHQTIRPYTDLLLHDMGPDLADGRQVHEASGSEWRTPPLWGLGLIPVVNAHTTLLHDGRARGAAEAILWHGGEAEAAREAFRAMSAAERGALIAFLEDL